MKNITRTFCVDNDMEDLEYGETESVFTLSVNNKRISMKIQSGRSPYGYEFIEAIKILVKEYLEENDFLFIPKTDRKYSFQFGFSFEPGQEDIVNFCIEEEKSHGPIIYQKTTRMFQKTADNMINAFSEVRYQDLLGFLALLGHIKMKNGYCYPAPSAELDLDIYVSEMADTDNFTADFDETFGISAFVKDHIDLDEKSLIISKNNSELIFYPKKE